MEEIIYMCDYSSSDLNPIIENIEISIESINMVLQELVKSRVMTEWLLGLNIAILCVLIALIFAIFFSNIK